MKGKKDFIASGAVYTILGFLPTASRFILFPLFLHYLTPEDFALISLNTMVAGILPTFMTLGLEQSMNKFYFDFVKFPKIEKVFLSTLIISVIGLCTVLSLVFILVGPHLFAWSFKSHRFTFFPYGFTALLAAIPGSMNMLFYNYLRCRKDLKNYVILNLGVFLTTSIGEIVAIVFLKMHVEQLVWVKPFIMWPFMIVSVVVMLWKTGIHFEKRLFRLAYRYSTPLLPHLVFSLVFVYTDRIMIENNLNLTYLAIYNLTMAVSSIIDIFEQALRNATFPNIFKLLKENVQTNVDAISRIHTINGLILMGIVSAVSLMVPIGDYYFLKPVYRPLIYLIPFALIISVTRFFYIVYAEPLFFFKKVKHVSASTFLQGTSSILFNFLLIPRLGLMGAILANIMSKCIQVTYIYFMSISIKIFSYRVGFILTSMFILITILICLTFSGHYFVDDRVIIHILATAPLIFTSFVFAYFIKKNKISLKQLW